jgi:hypothetical protein
MIGPQAQNPKLKTCMATPQETEIQVRLQRMDVMASIGWRHIVNRFQPFEERHFPASILLITKDLCEETSP